MAQMYSKFPGTCQACRTRFAAGTLIDWSRETGARHADETVCAQARQAAAVAPPAPRLDLGPVAAFIGAARQRGLKFPALRVLDVSGTSELRLSLTVKGAAPGSIAVKRGGEFVGCIRPTGETTGGLQADPALQAHLLRVAEAPVQAAQAFAALTCRCSFCNLPLTDEGSVEVGYGPICATHWGLPHRPRGTRTLQQETAA